MSILLDGTGGVTTPGVVNTAGETIATTLAVTGATNLSALTTTGNTILGDASTDTLNVGNGGLVKDASGNVGIGTASPSRKLDIAATAYSANQIGGLRLNNTSAVAANYFDVLFGLDSGGIPYGSLQTGNEANSYMTFFTGSGPTERMRIDASGNLLFNSGYGSVATAYGCRAWVNFNGTGTVAIRASGNVSSITDQGVGQYAVNFTTAMPDANYASVGNSGPNTTTNSADTVCSANTTSSFDVRHFESNAATDVLILNASIFR